MGPYVVSIADVDRTHVAVVGGKGAHLGELARLEGVRVPSGFCVTTHAFVRLMREAEPIDELIEAMSRLAADDRDAIRALSAEARASIERAPIPGEVAGDITRGLARLREPAACAVRSSATAEDLPSGSFAGQHDSFLDVIGPEAILQNVRRCWASLFTERAVSYRLRNGVDHRKVRMAVVVQRMMTPQSAGVLFTADPVTGHRKVSTIEAVPGLGDALVSGQVRADTWKVRDGEIVAKAFAPERQEQPALADAEVLRLVGLGRRIEAHFGGPQDIEWGLADEEFHIVQSRPVTALFPIPDTTETGTRVYVSVGHQQMMTDAMKPLGISVWQLTAARPMSHAGGRLFVDVTPELSSPAMRARLLEALGKSDPLIGDALQTVAERESFIATRPDEGASAGPPGGIAPSIETDAAIVEELIAQSERSVEQLKRDIQGKSGPALLEFILADLQELKRILFDPRSRQVTMAGMQAAWWLNERLEAWLGERNAADVLTQSVPHNVTSEMGLALLDVADVIRRHPDVVRFLGHTMDDAFLDELTSVEGGREARAAIQAWLDRYGMRCDGEIDITRPRWSERPAMLLPALLGHVRHFDPGAGRRRFEQGLRSAHAKRDELLARLRALPDGEGKADEARRMIERLRTFIGYREYPKYGMISRYFIYKRALMEEAVRLVRAQVLRDKEDIFFLAFHELHEVVRTRRADPTLIEARRDAFAAYRTLTPPRVMTSDGEIVTGAYRRDDVPPDALVGLPVSAGTVEGRARVVLDMAKADLAPGDILVTTSTDPSWSPLFVTIAALVTEVGGLMTHGAVVAREYGLPAVVGVERATELIRDGQRIRVHGTRGYVEILQ